MAEVYNSVWDAIENTPSESENMKLRSNLMISIVEHIKERGWRQVQAAKYLGVTQPRISDLMRGRVDLFGLDALVGMVSAMGMHVDMRISKAA